MQKVAALSRRSFIGGAAALGALSLVSPASAFAVSAAEKQAEADEVRNRLIGLQADYEASEMKYHQALAEQDAARTAMEEEQVKIDDTTTQIQNLQGKLSVRARSMYRSGSSSFLDFLLGSASFSEFTQNWDILEKINSDDATMVDTAKTLRDDLQIAKDEFARQEAIAGAKAAEAATIKAAAEAKVSEASTLMNSLDAEARALLEQEQAAAAIVAAQQVAENARRNQQSNGGGSDDGNNNNEGGGNGREVPSYGSVVDYALSRVGCPYVMGGGGPNEFDCSGLVQWAYAQVGIYVPHQSESLYACATQIVSVSEARPGDVLYRFGHVGIAVGYGGVPYVHAPTPGALVRATDGLAWSGFTHALRFG